MIVGRVTGSLPVVAEMPAISTAIRSAADMHDVGWPDPAAVLQRIDRPQLRGEFADVVQGRRGHGDLLQRQAFQALRSNCVTGPIAPRWHYPSK